MLVKGVYYAGLAECLWFAYWLLSGEVRLSGICGSSFVARERQRQAATTHPRALHKTVPMTKPAALRPSIASEMSSDGQKRSKTVPQKQPRLRQIGLNEAVSRMETSSSGT